MEEKKMVRISEIAATVQAIQDWMEKEQMPPNDLDKEAARENRLITCVSFDKSGAHISRFVVYKGGGYGEGSTSRSWCDIEKFLVGKNLI